MVVNVTPAQYAYIAEAMLQAEMTRDPKDVQHVIGTLCLCCLDNGGDFDPRIARIIETQIVVISEWKRIRPKAGEE